MILAIWLDLGIIGLAIAYTISNFIMLASLLYFCKWIEDSVGHIKYIPDWNSFTGLSDYLKLSLPSMTIVCSKVWSLQIFAFAAGTLG